MLRVPATRSDEDLAIELVSAHGVSVHPGHFYDFSSERVIVVSLLVPEMQFTRGISELLAFCGSAPTLA